MLVYENLKDLIVSFSILELRLSKKLIPPIKLDTHVWEKHSSLLSSY